MFVGNPLNSFVLFDNTTQGELTMMNKNGKNTHSYTSLKKCAYAFFLRIERIYVVHLILTCTVGGGGAKSQKFRSNV